MGLLEQLQSGRLGFELKVPTNLTPSPDLSDRNVQFVDADKGVIFWFFFFPGIYLDLASEHAGSLERDIKRHTRLLFDLMYDEDVGSEPTPMARRRTDDPAWDPVIEIERHEVHRKPALTVLHRMQYQPARELVMGHTLVPVEDGLFEARWLARELSATGYRETILSIKSTTDDGRPTLSQADFDAPVHDETFKQHPLSRARSVKTWHVDHLLVAKPFRGTSRDPELAALGCALTVPERFAVGDTNTRDGECSVELNRASFAGTDGVDQLIVIKTAERIRALATQRRLASFARNYMPQMLEGLTNTKLETIAIDGTGITFLGEGDANATGVGRARSVWRWFLAPNGLVWTIGFVSTVAVPVEEMVADVMAAASSWRSL
ncbi:MAG: hypothetical protein QM831_22830 [Kofleriaceae bacterium]